MILKCLFTVVLLVFPHINAMEDWKMVTEKVLLSELETMAPMILDYFRAKAAADEKLALMKHEIRMEPLRKAVSKYEQILADQTASTLMKEIAAEEITFIRDIEMKGSELICREQISQISQYIMTEIRDRLNHFKRTVDQPNELSIRDSQKEDQRVSRCWLYQPQNEREAFAQSKFNGIPTIIAMIENVTLEQSVRENEAKHLYSTIRFLGTDLYIPSATQATQKKMTFSEAEQKKKCRCERVLNANYGEQYFSDWREKYHVAFEWYFLVKERAKALEINILDALKNEVEEYHKKHESV